MKIPLNFGVLKCLLKYVKWTYKFYHDPKFVQNFKKKNIVKYLYEILNINLKKLKQ